MTSPNPAGAAVHSRIHTSGYYAEVNELLSQAGTRTEVLEVLAFIKDLRELSLAYVAHVDDPSAILGLPLSRFEVMGGAFDTAFAEATAGRRAWWVPNPRRNDGGTGDRFEVTNTADRVEITFRDFAWLAEHLSLDDDEIVSDDVERVLEQHLERTRREWVDDSLIVFDSEADATILVVPNTELAQVVAADLNGLFSNKRRLRAAVKRALEDR